MCQLMIHLFHLQGSRARQYLLRVAIVIGFDFIFAGFGFLSENSSGP
jgi:hypothetical protein